MLKRLLWMLLWLYSGPGVTAEQYFSIDTLLTRPEFVIRHLGMPLISGRFTPGPGIVTLDPEAGSGCIAIAIAADSLRTGLAFLDQVLAGENFLHTERFPYIRFHADQFAFEANRPVTVEGLLTLRGITRPVKLSIDAFNCETGGEDTASGCSAQVQALVNRSEFGIDSYRPWVTNDVHITISVFASPLPDVPDKPEDCCC